MACPVAYAIPRRELFEKRSVYISKQNNSRPTGKKIQKNNKDKAFKTYNDEFHNKS